MGRLKGSKKKRHGEPTNFAYWRFVLANPEEINTFIDRGTKEQKSLMKQTLKHLNRGSTEKTIYDLHDQYKTDRDLEFFKQINGKEILRRLK